MKHLFLSLLLIFMSFELFGQNVEVPQTQTPLIVKIAASWCPPCGQWGWDFFDDIYDDNEENAIFLSVHHSGVHTNISAYDMTVNFNVFSQPRYILDGTDQNVSSSNVAAKRTEIQDQVNLEIEKEPLIQTGLDASHLDGMLNVDYSVKLFSDLSGEYNLALYLVEKVHYGYQASVGPDAAHKGLLRLELSGNSLGNQLFSGEASSGDVFNGDISIELGDYDPENLEIVSVIWKKSANNYEVVNSNVDEEVEDEMTSQLDDPLRGNWLLNIYPTHVKNQLNINIDSKYEQEEVNIVVKDIIGRNVASLYNGKLANGKNEIKLNRPGGIRTGMYFIVIETGFQNFTRKIFFE